MIATHGVHGDGGILVAALIVMLVACLLAAIVYFGSRAAGRPDIGGAGAAITLLIGAIIALLVAV